MKTVPIIKITDNPGFSKEHLEVSVRFDWEFEAPGKSRDVLVTFHMERGSFSIEQLRESAVARARQILQEAITPPSS